MPMREYDLRIMNYDCIGNITDCPILYYSILSQSHSVLWCMRLHVSTPSFINGTITLYPAYHTNNFVFH